MSVSMTRAVTIAMNVGFDDEGGHDSHVGFEASTVTIAMSVSMTRAVTIAMNVGFEASTVTIAMSVSRPVRS